MRTIQELILNMTGGAGAAHAFACEGRAGGKRSEFITSLAAGLLCTSDEGEGRPCGKCASCIQAAAGTSMDIVHMSKSTGSSRSGREIYRVDDAAAFIERLSMGSYGRYLIGIIDDADTLSETIQNKLLKTLEEPSPDTVILLGVSNGDNLLSTVRSRVSRLRLSDFAGYADEENGGTEGNEEMRLSAAAEDLAEMYTDRTAGFYEVRNTLDKGVKSREEALLLLDTIEDGFRERMTAAGHGEYGADPQACARAIELIGIARMDIRREMNYNRALKRLYLEI